MKDHIKETWNSQAEKFKDSYWASWGDHYAVSLEIENISKYIADNSFVLDVGCANGYSTFKQFERHNIRIQGVDFSEKMIENAIIQKEKLALGDNIEFEIADIRELPFADATFDLTYTTRVIINLPNWEDQMKSINECLRVTKKGGMVILSEAFWEPLMLLNALRTLKNLPALVEHDFNRYLKKQSVIDYLKQQTIEDFIIDDFSSIYYLGSRFLRELVTNSDDFPGYSNPINEIFYNIENDFSGGGFGIQQAIVIKK